MNRKINLSNIKIIPITFVFLLTTIYILSAEPAAVASKSHYNHAEETLANAQRAEETARVSSYASDIANYYKIALKNYSLALKEAQRSKEESEPLSDNEQKNRKHIINESLRKIEICKNKYDDATYRKYYDNAVRDFEIAQKAEENSRWSFYPRSRADYYQIALKNYKLSLKQARRSAERVEELSEREKYNRMRIINESRERIDVCKKRYSAAIVDSDIEDLRQKAHNYVIAGFNYATANDKRSAKRSWDKALSLYKEVLTHTKDEAAQEVIKSKIKAISTYLEYSNEQ